MAELMRDTFLWRRQCLLYTLGHLFVSWTVSCWQKRRRPEYCYSKSGTWYCQPYTFSCIGCWGMNWEGSCPGVRYFLSVWRNSPTRARTASFVRFVDYTIWHATFGRTVLVKGSVRRRPPPDNTTLAEKETCMPPAGFEPVISAGGRPPTLVLYRLVTGIGDVRYTT
jgi:hypothetical protein